MATQSRATELLLSLRDGNQGALDELVPLVYDELRAIARRKLRHERRSHTLNSAALVHEAYLKLVQIDRMEWQSRAHFLGIAARVMRNILVNHALRRNRVKHGGGAPLAPLEEGSNLASNLPAQEAERILALDAALEKLAAMNPRHARVVECRFFGGMTIEETAAALAVSGATVERDWALLRVWLGRELGRMP
jgi:RNA polymerase sigma factor (TIGR02999 family)